MWEVGTTPSFDGDAGRDERHAGASIALLRGEELIGVLNLTGSQRHVFAAVDRRLLERVGTHLSLAINNARLYEEIKRMHLGNLKALSSALNAKDYYTLGHAARVGAYMVLLGHELGWSEETTHEVEEAAYLHDIGKIGVSDRVLLKPSRPELARMGAHAPAPDLLGRHPAPSVRRRPRARRAPPSRALGRFRLSRRSRRRGDPARGARACASPTPTTPCRSGAPTARPCAYHEALAELDRCAGRSSTRTIVAPSSACSLGSTNSAPQAREIAARRPRASTRSSTPPCARRATRARPEYARHRGRVAARARRPPAGAVHHDDSRRR